MPLLPYDYLHLVNCPQVVIISDILCMRYPRILGQNLRSHPVENPPINGPPCIPAATASSCEAAAPLSAEEINAAAKQSPAPDTHTTLESMGSTG